MIKLYLGAETNTVSSKKGDLDGNQEKSNKEKSNKEKSNKEKSNKEKSDKEKSNKEKSNKEKSNKEKSNKEKSKSQEKINKNDCFSFRLMLIEVDLISIQSLTYKLVSFQRPTNTTTLF
jgi:hypothetical protein